VKRSKHPRGFATRRVWNRAAMVARIGAVVALGVACAPKQRVPLECVPDEVTVYVDQRALDEHPDALELRSDEPHKIYFKGPGYEPQLIVLEPEYDENGEPRLSPDRICVELVAVGVDRQLDVDVERDGDPAHP
jgi:hypothetical protein